jgi:hypothetical protein
VKGVFREVRAVRFTEDRTGWTAGWKLASRFTSNLMHRNAQLTLGYEAGRRLKVRSRQRQMGQLLLEADVSTMRKRKNFYLKI